MQSTTHGHPQSYTCVHSEVSNFIFRQTSVYFNSVSLAIDIFPLTCSVKHCLRGEGGAEKDKNEGCRGRQWGRVWGVTKIGEERRKMRGEGRGVNEKRRWKEDISRCQKFSWKTKIQNKTNQPNPFTPNAYSTFLNTGHKYTVSFFKWFPQTAWHCDLQETLKEYQHDE